MRFILFFMIVWSSTSMGQSASPGKAVFDVRSFGAKCDGSADDGPAFNMAIAALRATAVGGSPPFGLLTWAGCNAVIKTTINFTSVKSNQISIDGSGGLLNGLTNGLPVIDALGTENLRWHDVSIYGSQSPSRPNIGIQIGRVSVRDAADNNHFENLSLTGDFSLAGLLNEASETTQFSHLLISNTFQTTTPLQSFALAEDGVNHLDVKSNYVTVTLPQDVNTSLDSNVFVLPIILNNGPNGVTPIFLGATSNTSFLGGYVSNFDSSLTSAAAGYVIELWNVAAGNVGTQPAGANQHLLFLNTHVEAHPTDIFFITGPKSPPLNIQPVMNGLRFDDGTLQAGNSIFKLDPDIVAAAINGLELHVSIFADTSVQIFDQPSKWTVGGTIFLGADGHWTSPSLFNGLIVSGVAATLKADNVEGNSVHGNTVTSSGTITAGGLVTAPSIGVTGSIGTTAFSTGGDPANGAINLGLVSGTGTPYIDYYGISNIRIIGDSANQLSIQSRLFNNSIITFQGGTSTGSGNQIRAHSAFVVDGSFGVNGAGPVNRTDITGSCGGNVVCQKMAALLISAGFASGTVTP